MSDPVTAAAADLHWVHDLDPFMIQFTDSIGIRWYGFAYLLGLLSAWWLIRRLAKKQLIPLHPHQAADLATYIGIGMLVGGRIGYCIGYDPSLFGFSEGAPWWGVLKLWEGGMASHGGLAGFFLGNWYFCKKNKIRFFISGDLVATFAGLGVFFGRMANFINGELYGRITTVSWGVYFPSSLAEVPPGEQADRWSAYALQAGLDPNTSLLSMRAYQQQLVPGTPTYDAFYRAMVDVRHPSQIYAALLEGLLIFVVSYVTFLRHRRPGLTAGIALMLYAVVRIINENWRQWDIGHDPWLGLTKGQLYSIPFFLVGGWLVFMAWRRGSEPDAYRIPDLAGPPSPQK